MGNFGAIASNGTIAAADLASGVYSGITGLGTQAQTLLPNVDATLDLGSAAQRWNLVRAVTVTTGDLNLVREDGSAKWTLRETPDHIELLNRVNGKRYRMLMEEILG